MIKKLLLTVAAAALVAFPSMAQLGIFNHVGADLSIGTTGIGVELSSPITSWVQMRAGLSVMPGFSFNTTADGYLNLTHSDVVAEPFSMDVKGGLKRTQGDVIFNVYPFGPVSKFFVAAGAYFGGKSLVKINGHSDQIEQLQQSGSLTSGFVEIGDYKVDLEPGGNINAALVSKNFRPYLGLGFGRPCPSGRLGFMFELGVQFMGKTKICQGKDLRPVDISGFDSDDDWQKIMDKVTVYPVMKFTLSGRIF